MLLHILFTASLVGTIIFGFLGINRFFKTIPLMSAKVAKGIVKDARFTNANILGESFQEAKSYLYYQYKVDGITYGNSDYSVVKNGLSKSKIEGLARRFEEEGQFEIPVYYQKKDPRRAYLVSASRTPNPSLMISGVLFLISLLSFFVK